MDEVKSEDDRLLIGHPYDDVFCRPQARLLECLEMPSREDRKTTLSPLF